MRLHWLRTIYPDLTADRLHWAPAITRAWYVSVLLLALALPFEVSAPWLQIGGTLGLTNLELLAFASLGLFAARQIAIRQLPHWKTPLTLPVVVMLAVLFLATLFAPSHNYDALKVTLRWVTGVLIGLMIVNALETGLPMRPLVQAFVIGGVIVALGAWLEMYAYEGVRTAFAPFRDPRPFRVGGEARASSTLAYPTITAMYLEIIFFLTVGWLALEFSRRLVRAGLLTTVLFLVAQSVVFTMTRSALIGIGLAIIAILIARWRHTRLDTFSRAALLGAAILLLAVFGATFSSSQTQLRLSSESDRTWYRARYETAPLPPLRANESITVPVRVQNIGQVTWETSGSKAVHLFYHWLTRDGDYMVIAEGVRSNLPHSVAPGETIEVQARVNTPSESGEFILAWDMVREDLFWFSVLGADMGNTEASILPTAVVKTIPRSLTRINVVKDLNLDRPTLWRGALIMLTARPLLGVGPGNYRLVLGQYLDLPTWDYRLHANNMYLEMLADTGLAGGLAFLVLVFSIAQLAWSRINQVFELETSADQAILVSAVACALASFFLHGVTDYFLEFTPIYLAFWILVGMLVAGTPRQRSPV